MRIAIFNTVQLETAGGMEHFSIQTAAYLASLSGVEVDCVTMDEVFNLRYGGCTRSIFSGDSIVPPSFVNRERRSISGLVKRGMCSVPRSPSCARRLANMI